ncbi:MAG: 4Fe-4S binding protein [Desulfomonilaceae bacterium]
MSDSPYMKLRSFLDRFPLGFPKTDSGVELKILRRLFTEEEAELVVSLMPFPEEASQIAQRTGLDEKELTEKLESMSRRGLLFRIRRGGKTSYNVPPFMIGLYEYSVKKIDKELAMLFKEYYDTAYMREMGASNVPGFKVIPIGENIHGGTVLYPYMRLKEDVKAARKIAVADCICRKEARLTGEGCNHPIETCLSFGIAAEYYIENGIGREITAEEAIEILHDADRAGLVHAGANVKHLSNICNCCPCCCASLKGITKWGLDKQKFMNALFEAVVDKEECIGCEDCVGRCPVGAITVQDTAEVDRSKCLGCGLCSTSCPSQAITMHQREDKVEPFEKVLDLGMAILKGKKENVR